jgi:hypothetical protein
VPSLTKVNSTSIRPDAVGTHLVELCDVADLLNIFQPVHNNPFLRVFLSLPLTSEFLSLAPASDSDVSKHLNVLDHLSLSVFMTPLALF